MAHLLHEHRINTYYNLHKHSIHFLYINDTFLKIVVKQGNLNVAKNPQLFSLSFQIANENISDLKYLCGKKQGNYKFTTAACNNCK